jgi:homoserine dehydrogenase
MPHYNLALLGFGNVGQALGRLLLQKQADILSRYGITFSVTGIATARHGTAINSDGLDLEHALRLANEGASLNQLSRQPAPADALSFIRQCPANVLFENSPVNYQGASSTSNRP